MKKRACNVAPMIEGVSSIIGSACVSDEAFAYNYLYIIGGRGCVFYKQ